MKWLLKVVLLLCLLQLACAVKICFTRPETTSPATPTTTSSTPTSRTTSKTPSSPDPDPSIAQIDSSELVPGVTMGLVMVTAEAAPTPVSPHAVPAMPATAPPTSSQAPTPKANRTKVRVRPKTTSTTTTTTVEPDVEAESEEVDTDDDNDSEEKSRTHGVGRSSTGRRTGHGNFCSCNLLPEACDLNCCCDPDCSPRALQVFDCYAESEHAELRTRLEDFQYQHGLPSCRINDGWLCVFRSNADINKEAQVTRLDFDTSSFYKWPSLTQEFVTPDQRRAEAGFYRFGQPLQLLDQETLEVRNFELPYAFVQPHCQLRDHVRHLKETRRQCLVNSLDQLQQNTRDLVDLVIQHRLLRTPSQEIVDVEKTGANMLEWALMRCHSGVGGDGQCLETNATELGMEGHYSGKIEILLRHNYTNLLDRAVVRLWEWESETLTGPGAADAPEEEYWLTFEVGFEFYNGSTGEPIPEHAEPVAISGPMGYLQGQPLITAKLTQYNQSLEPNTDNALLDYFHPNATRLRRHHAIALMSKRQGLCHKDLTKKGNLVNYGINVLQQCKVRLDNTTDFSDSPEDRNFTSVCIQLQELALNQLLPTNSTPESMQQLWISQLGKPENDTDTKWSKFELKNYEYAPIVGTFDPATRSFTCRNILLSVAYEFQVGRFRQQGIRHQNLLKHAAIVFGHRHDMEYSLTEVIEMPLTMSVMFYDYVDAEKQLRSGAHAELLPISTTIVAYLVSKHFI